MLQELRKFCYATCCPKMVRSLHQVGSLRMASRGKAKETLGLFSFGIEIGGIEATEYVVNRSSRNLTVTPICLDAHCSTPAPISLGSSPKISIQPYKIADRIRL